MFKRSSRLSTTTPSSSSSSLPPFLTITNIALRFLQFVFAITVAGLYGVDLNHARKYEVDADSRWVYAEVVAGLSAVTALVFAVPFFKSHWGFGWDGVLFILWTALFGIFGKLFIHISSREADNNSALKRMKHAVWIDLINMLLWLVTFLFSAALWLKFRTGRSLHTGRARV